MLNQNLLLTGDDGYNLTNSLRFRDSASAYLNRTPASASNRRTWTWSGWVKRGTLGAINDGIFSAGTSFGTNNNDIQTITFNNDCIVLVSEVGGSIQYNLVTSQVFRDPSAWYHFVIAFDTTQATSSNRVKLYVNGLQVTAFSTSTYPSQNYDGWINSANQHRIASRVSPDFDGYMAEINFIDGQALTPSSFGSTNALTGVWQPAKYTGSYGTNGFYLPFTNTTSTSTLGNDFSGNSNTWTVNNISLTAGATYDSMTDVPTLTSATAANYCVLNPLNTAGGLTANSGNLNTTGTNNLQQIAGTFGMSVGKWYYEQTVVARGGSTSIGIGGSPRANSYVGDAIDQYGYFAINGDKYTNSSNAAYGATYTTGDIIGVAYDADTGSLSFYKNGASQGVAFTGITGTMFPLVDGRTTGGTSQQALNFGQRPFSYTPPTGFVALNTFNLPTSTIVKGNTVMDATTYTGNGSAGRVITMSNMTNVGLAWLKLRSGADDHRLANTVTGGNRHLKSNATDVEATGTNVIQAFSGNTFTIGSDSSINGNGSTYVGWVWANDGTSGSTNTAGSISAQVSANTTAGFSVVTYTGTGANATVGHGLGVAPSMIIVKNRTTETSEVWLVRHSSLVGNDKYIILNRTDPEGSLTSAWNNTAPTSSVFSIGTLADVNRSTNTYVAYCWSQIAGYSAFGSYTGNGSADGPFVYTGFRPRFVMIKRSSSAESWVIEDTARDPYNLTVNKLYANSSSAEDAGNTYGTMDILSNGFKLRASHPIQNASGGTYIYMAFCENPFKNALAR
jgi:hypothetical protein